jgi:hypothetical protein
MGRGATVIKRSMGREGRMKKYSKAVLLLEGINQADSQITDMLGDSRYEFQDRMTEILMRMSNSEDDEELDLWLDELVNLGLESEAAPVFGEIVTTARSGDLVVDEPSLLPYVESVDLTEFRVPAEPDTVRAAAKSLARMVGSMEELAIDAPPGEPGPRYLNAGLYVGSEMVPVEEPPSLDGGPYQLVVNVGRRWGIGRADVPFPEEALTDYYSGPILEVDLVARSLDADIDVPVQPLLLPQEDNSPVVVFGLTFRREGRMAVNVDLLYRGNLIQSRRFEFEVTAHAGTELPESAWPVQDGYTTFTRTTELTQDNLGWLDENPRRLTIVAERDLDSSRIGLRFYDGTGDDMGFLQSTLSDESLTTMLKALRGRLLETMNEYGGSVGSTAAVLTKHLGQLAAAGRRFYLALLPGLAGREGLADEGQRLDVKLQPEDVIQVAPLSAQLSVPWELLYERKIEEYREDRISLCDSFREHGPNTEDCPHHGDATVVCPHGFWGYRYVIEQLPCRVDPGEDERPFTLPFQIPNNLPTKLSASISTQLDHIDDTLSALRGLAGEDRLEMERVENLEQVRAELTEGEAHILYFYAHGGSDDFDSPFLEVGQSDQIKLIDLDAWDVWLDSQPLMFLNTCESAEYAPDSFENLIKYFCSIGAAGVVGAQCDLRELLATDFATKFFQRFFQQVPAGKALYEARRALLNDQLDPRGLTYSLFAAADVRLAQPIIV